MTFLIITVIAVWLAQRLLAVHQAMRFRRQYSALRRNGRAVAVGAAKRVGRRVYVALAADEDGTIVENMVFRGMTVFAAGKGDPRLDGARVADLEVGKAPVGVNSLVVEAARQAAGFLTAAGERDAIRTAAALRTADRRKVRTSSRG